MADADRLFEPRSIAILGASADPRKWGHHLARAALRGQTKRNIHLINPREHEILGQHVYQSVLELPEAPELAVIAVPAASVEAVVDQCLRQNVKAVVMVTAGYERGRHAKMRQESLANRIRQSGARLLGPNSAGLGEPTAAFEVSFRALPAGRVGVISQSGNLLDEIAQLGAGIGLGFSRYVSVGNQADLTAVDFLRSLGQHPPTHAIACYLEDFKDGREFCRVAAAIVEAGKPVALLTGGRTDPGRRTAVSHTRALVSDSHIVAAACRDAGIELVQTPGEMVDVLAAATAAPARGRRVGIVGDGGGGCAVAADLLAKSGLQVPRFGTTVRRNLSQQLPATSSTGNPVDLSGATETDPLVYSRVVSSVLESNEVDVVLMTGFFGGYGSFGESFLAGEREAARSICDAAAKSGKAVFVHTAYPGSAVVPLLRGGGVPVYERIEGAVRALAAVCPRPRSTSNGSWRRARTAGKTAGTSAADSYWLARRALAEAGIALAQASQASNAEEAVEVAARIGYPVVVKALGRLHKSADGGVVIGIPTPRDLRNIVQDLSERLSPPQFSIEAMEQRDCGVEVLVGFRSDLRFGRALTIGWGGVNAEDLNDVAVALLPVTRSAIKDMLARLRCSQALRRQRCDVPTLITATLNLAKVLARHPEIYEMEVNPLLVRPSGVVALDARIVPSPLGLAAAAPRTGRR
jgi:acetate---CoA ligase (ADP-forming)